MKEIILLIIVIVAIAKMFVIAWKADYYEEQISENSMYIISNRDFKTIIRLLKRFEQTETDLTVVRNAEDKRQTKLILKNLTSKLNAQ